jgi:hypothetical protein
LLVWVPTGATNSTLTSVPAGTWQQDGAATAGWAGFVGAASACDRTMVSDKAATKGQFIDGAPELKPQFLGAQAGGIGSCPEAAPCQA